MKSYGVIGVATFNKIRNNEENYSHGNKHLASKSDYFEERRMYSFRCKVSHLSADHE